MISTHMTSQKLFQMLTDLKPKSPLKRKVVRLSRIMTPGEGVWSACAAYCEMILWDGAFQISKNAKYLILTRWSDDEGGIDHASFTNPESFEWAEGEAA